MNILKISNQENLMMVHWLMDDSFESQNRVYCFGNGGLASACSHFVGELNKTYRSPRNKYRDLKRELSFLSNLEYGYPIISLCECNALISAISNDIGYDYVFAQQLYVLGNAGDIAIGMTTSGTSKNILMGLETAHSLGMKTILITQQTEFEYKYVDYIIQSESNNTAEIQEEILNFMHKLCNLFETKENKCTKI